MTGELIPLTPPTYEVGITVSESLFAELVALAHEYRDECEGLGMPQTVAAIERVLAKVASV